MEEGRTHSSSSQTLLDQYPELQRSCHSLVLGKSSSRRGERVTFPDEWDFLGGDEGQESIGHHVSVTTAWLVRILRRSKTSRSKPCWECAILLTFRIMVFNPRELKFLGLHLTLLQTGLRGLSHVRCLQRSAFPRSGSFVRRKQNLKWLEGSFQPTLSIG